MSEPGTEAPALSPAAVRADGPDQAEQAGPADRANQAEQADRAAEAAQAALADRERGLFRHATRAGQIHPLRHLLRRYRAGERA